MTPIKFPQYSFKDFLVMHNPFLDVSPRRIGKGTDISSWGQNASNSNFLRGIFIGDRSHTKYYSSTTF